MKRPPSWSLPAWGLKTYLDVQLVGEHESERHLLLSFVGGVSEHESLITSADVFVGAVLVDALRDVGRLLLETVLDSACEVIQTFFVRVVSDSLEKNKNYDFFWRIFTLIVSRMTFW